MPRGRVRKCQNCFNFGLPCNRSHLIKIKEARPLLSSLLYREFFIRRVEESDEFKGAFQKYYAGTITLVDLLDLLEERLIKLKPFGMNGIRLRCNSLPSRVAIEMLGVNIKGSRE